MSISELLQPLIQNYIIEKTGSDISKLALQKNPFPSIDFKIILNQIELRTKVKTNYPLGLLLQILFILVKFH